MIGDGRTLNHPVYVENLVDLFELTGTHPAAKGRIYLAGDDAPVTLTELVQRVGAAIGTQVRILRFPWYRIAWLGATAIESTSKLVGVRPLIGPSASWVTSRECGSRMGWHGLQSGTEALAICRALGHAKPERVGHSFWH
jgi:uncharacterized protein YbjT (DUF2867 family)